MGGEGKKEAEYTPLFFNQIVFNKVQSIWLSHRVKIIVLNSKDLHTGLADGNFSAWKGKTDTTVRKPVISSNFTV